MSHRIKCINKLIKQELGKVFLKELDLPSGILATITKVDTSRDLHWADVWITIFPSEVKEKNFKKIERSIGHLQFLLNKNLSLKRLPRLRFKLDETEDRVEEIENLLDKKKGDVYS